MHLHLIHPYTVQSGRPRHMYELVHMHGTHTAQTTHTRSMRQTYVELPEENGLIHVAALHEAQTYLEQERLRGLSKELLRVHDGRLPFLCHLLSLPQHFCLYGQRAIITLCARPCWHTINNTMCEWIESPARPYTTHQLCLPEQLGFSFFSLLVQVIGGKWVKSSV